MVEMDGYRDFDQLAENLLTVGDQIVATGRIDDDFYERRTLEAAPSI